MGNNIPYSLNEVARSRHEASRLIRTRFTIALLVLVAVLLTSMALAVVPIRLSSKGRAVQNYSRVAAAAQTMALERLASIRAFIMTGDSATLQREIRYRAMLRAVLDTARGRSDSDPSLIAHLDTVTRALQEWERSFAYPMLAISRDSALTLNAEQLAGRTRYEPVRRAFSAFVGAASAKADRSHRNIRLALLGLAAALVVELAFLLFALLRFRRIILSKASALEEQQERLEEQAVELEQQAVELETTNEELAVAAAEAEAARDRSEGALAQLEMQTALLASALDSSPLGFGFVTPDLKHVRVSKAYARMWSRPAEEFIGKTPSELNLDDAVAVEGTLKEILRTGDFVHDAELDTGGTRGSANGAHYLATYFPIRSESGDVLGAGIVASDLSEQKRLEAELRQSQKMEAVGQLAGGIAHDFNNLLTVIVGHGEMLLAQLEDPLAISDAQQIQRAASQAAALTQKLLAFSRKQVLLPRVIVLNDVLEGISPMLRRLIREDIEIDVRTESRLKRVKADPTQIEQVLLNLTVNARDAMPHGGRLTVRTENALLDDDYLRSHGIVGEAGEYVVLIVGDTGIGMNENVRERAFEPFFTTKETGKGTGLGLATVYGIVKQSGGHIWLYSEPGIGTTFKIYLPVHEGDLREGWKETSSAAPARGEETVLLVEDDPTVLGLTNRQLEALGYKVFTATDGHAALRVFESNRSGIDLVLTDVVMPKMGGAELVRRLWSFDASLPVVYMSGYAGDDMLDRGILESDAVYVQKPFTTQMLAHAVRSALERAARHQTAGRESGRRAQDSNL